MLFGGFAQVGVTTPQQNDCLGPNSLKNIVFLKVALTKHAFLHVFDMLEAKPRSSRWHGRRVVGSSEAGRRVVRSLSRRAVGSLGR